ncbi:UDP-2,3-diacylglucosamine diphosphatase [Nevskia sp.]|uniref:UDP-2,3-diacylglucosamine diphosphatase n=1 Tax=Nevskia sp. TaxID=1929292 RepID=UPI0025EBADEB|nr:UDP-2,3-diacylglucosamine diphosphatase [Nevskia sp.]
MIFLLSDLHLPNTPSLLRDRFLAFLAGPAREAEAVYILGDLFEVWIGDAEGLSDHAAEADALRALRDSGVKLYFQHGNRDFLLGRRYAERAGLELLADPAVVALDGSPTLLSHGDRWCSDDLAYQRWRRFSRKPLTQLIFRSLPKRLRARLAGAARGQSDRDKARKPAAIMDVNSDAIRDAFTSSGVRRIIHGHTHRPARHRLDIGGVACERIVLADWRASRCEVLALRDGQFTALSLLA